MMVNISTDINKTNHHVTYHLNLLNMKKDNDI